VSGFSRERERDGFFKELAHSCGHLINPKSDRAGRQGGDSGKSHSFDTQGVCSLNSFLLQGSQS
jgi:hypothetical protein